MNRTLRYYPLTRKAWRYFLKLKNKNMATIKEVLNSEIQLATNRVFFHPCIDIWHNGDGLCQNWIESEQEALKLAKMIKIAPEMLQFLEEFCEVCNKNHFHLQLFTPEYTKAVGLIKKAKGEQ